MLDEFLRLSKEVDLRIDQERNSFFHNHLSDALDFNKDIWKEIRNLGLLPKRKEEDFARPYTGGVERSLCRNFRVPS